MIRPDARNTTQHIRSILQPIFWRGCKDEKEIREVVAALGEAISEDARACVAKRFGKRKVTLKKKASGKKASGKKSAATEAEVE